MLNMAKREYDDMKKAYLDILDNFYNKYFILINYIDKH
jgi:hypothetical protein